MGAKVEIWRAFGRKGLAQGGQNVAQRTARAQKKSRRHCCPGSMKTPKTLLTNLMKTLFESVCS
jgi:hypothetical protein